MSTIVTEKLERSIYTASQWKLMWLAFKRHRLAIVGGIILLIAYLMVIFAEFLAPFHPEYRDEDSPFVPPMMIHVMTERRVHVPSVYTLVQIRDWETLRVRYEPDRSQRFPIRLLVRGDPYELWGVFETDLHLFGVRDGQRPYLLGTD